MAKGYFWLIYRKYKKLFAKHLIIYHREHKKTFNPVSYYLEKTLLKSAIYANNFFSGTIHAQNKTDHSLQNYSIFHWAKK